MARNNVNLTRVFRYVLQDGTTPRYLTVDGHSGGTKLSIAMSLAPYPDAGVQDTVMNFSTDGTSDGALRILDAPDDDKLCWTIQDTKMLTLPSMTYIADVVTPPLGPPRQGLGAFTLYVTGGVTQDPPSGP